MTSENIFYIIVWIIVFEFLLTILLSYLNTKNWSNKLPKELKWIYDEKKYKKSQDYEREKHIFWNISSSFYFIIIIFILFSQSFWHLDNIIWTFSDNTILQTLLFFLVIFIVFSLISLPFSYYSTFVLEEKYWFNKTTKKIFFTDIIKSLILTFVIWWLLLSLITYVYLRFDDIFWLLTWGIITAFSLFMVIFYSSLIVPIFNKQEPLGKWKLRDLIEDFSKELWFKLDNIFVIDWSKRSSKANAYFSWLGPKKRIVLYDTIIKDLDNKELISVLAHEIWHYKKKHTLQMLSFSIIQTWLILYILSLLLKIPEISFALWASNTSFHISIIAFSILFTPISVILWLFSNALSRKNEYEADYYAGKNYDPKKLMSALTKLSQNNLSNLRPHPVYEFFYYSHPTVLKRLKALENNQSITEIGVKSIEKAIIEIWKLVLLAHRANDISGIFRSKESIYNISQVWIIEKESICKVCFFL